MEAPNTIIGMKWSRDNAAKYNRKWLKEGDLVADSRHFILFAEE